jgi:hypothetical protein
MYLRKRCRIKGAIHYESWALVESVRTARGPGQRAIVTVGKLPGLDAEEKIGWEEIGRVPDGKLATTPSLFEQEPKRLSRGSCGKAGANPSENYGQLDSLQSPEVARSGACPSLSNPLALAMGRM